jgi:hypothetical protein
MGKVASGQPNRLSGLAPRGPEHGYSASRLLSRVSCKKRTNATVGPRRRVARAAKCYRRSWLYHGLAGRRETARPVAVDFGRVTTGTAVWPDLGTRDALTNDSDYYQILQVSRSAEQEVIHAAYRSLARKYHPDATAALSSSRMKQINAAYAILGDPVRRREYDRTHPDPSADLSTWNSCPGARTPPRAPQSDRPTPPPRSATAAPQPARAATTPRSRTPGPEWRTGSYRLSEEEEAGESGRGGFWLGALALVSIALVLVLVTGWGIAGVQAQGSLPGSAMALDSGTQVDSLTRGLQAVTAAESAFGLSSMLPLNGEAILALSLAVDLVLAFAIVIVWRRRFHRS